MFPVSLLPFYLDSGLLSNILKSFLFINPATALFTGIFILGFFSLKTMTAKLTFLGVSMFLSSVITYIAYKKEKKSEKQQNKNKSFVEYVENEKVIIDNEEKELMLSKIFKK